MTDVADRNIALFAYGTLQLPAVQLKTFGRLLDGEPDALMGFVLTPLAIDDPAVVKLSGLAIHQAACATGNATDRLSGMIFALSAAELAAADAYEVAAMTRIETDLESGRRGFVYVRDEA